jgi:hypothetical protein
MLSQLDKNKKGTNRNQTTIESQSIYSDFSNPNNPSPTLDCTTLKVPIDKNTNLDRSTFNLKG